MRIGRQYERWKKRQKWRKRDRERKKERVRDRKIATWMQCSLNSRCFTNSLSGSSRFNSLSVKQFCLYYFISKAVLHYFISTKHFRQICWLLLPAYTFLLAVKSITSNFSPTVCKNSLKQGRTRTYTCKLIVLCFLTHLFLSLCV